MTTATLARGPPISVAAALQQQQEEDDEDALMDEEDNNASPAGAGGGGALMIDDADVDMNSDDGGDGEYSSGEIVDYSGNSLSYFGGKNRKPGSSGSLSDGDGEQDNGNGSVQSFDEFQQGGDSNGKGSLSMIGKTGAKNGKNFVCDICHKTFSNAANMRRHRVRHSGIKPFECRFCQKRFFRKDHMREHMNHKHNNTQMECYFCQQVFDKEKDLFQHVTRDHDVNPRELHCLHCSFSATTIGRFLWHLTTSHPRKNAHYLDATGDAVSMAPYALAAAAAVAENDYESSPQTSPKLAQSSTSSAGHGSSSRTEGGTTAGIGYDYLTTTTGKASNKRDHATSNNSRDRRVSTSPPTQAPSQLNDHSSSNKRSRLYSSSTPDDDYPANGQLISGSRGKSSSAALDSVRYVSILPNKFSSLDNTSSILAQDLSSYSAPENLTKAYDVKSMLQHNKMNGSSALVAAAIAAAAAAESVAKGLAASSGSNRRKSKAPVRMAATPDEQHSTNGASSSSGKRDRDTILSEGARNGNESLGVGGGHFSPILEEVMSMQQRSGHNNFPEDLSSSNGNGHILSRTLSRLQPGSLSQRQKASPTENNIAGSMDALSRTASEQESGQKCPHCLIIYPDSVLYMLHKTLHSKDHPFRCTQCYKQHPNRYEFYAHIVNHGAGHSDNASQ